MGVVRLWSASTAISHRKDPVSSAPGSETMSSPFSTWIGDGLGIAGAVGFFSSLYNIIIIIIIIFLFDMKKKKQ